MSRKYKYITYDDRLQIEKLYLAGKSVCKIAAMLGFHHGTLYREIKRGYTGAMDKNGRAEYNPATAHKAIVGRFV